MDHIPQIERKSPAQIKAFQDIELKELLAYLNIHSKYYSRQFRTMEVDIPKINGIDDLIHLPVTTKEDLQSYNEEFVCVPQEKIIDMITTSGTMGDPVTFSMTDKDLDRLAYNEY